MTNTNKPQPCPVCGSPDPLIQQAVRPIYDPLFRARCPGACVITGPWSPTPDEAIKCWNRLAYLPDDWRETVRGAVMWLHNEMHEYHIGDEPWRDIRHHRDALQALLGESEGSDE